MRFKLADENVKFLRLKDVLEMVKLSKPYLYDLRAKGLFPQSYKISPKVAVWKESDVQDWMRKQLMTATRKRVKTTRRVCKLKRTMPIKLKSTKKG
jgi:prophage regulatory protein